MRNLYTTALRETLANNKNSKTNVLKLFKNINGLKQAGRVLNLDLLKVDITKFIQS